MNKDYKNMGGRTRNIPEICQRLKCYDRGQGEGVYISENEAINATKYLSERLMAWDEHLNDARHARFDNAVYTLLLATLESYSVEAAQ